MTKHIHAQKQRCDAIKVGLKRSRRLCW